MADALVAALTGVVGDAHVLVDPAVTASYTNDWTGRFSGRARAVVRPADAGEVGQVLAACAAAGAAVVPQGGNTGLVGGGVPRGGEVVVSLARLDDLEPVETAAAQVTAGAGVTLARLQAHAAASGLAYGVDFAARDSATVGGTVATNAGGVHVVRHGDTRRQLLGVEAVLADGRVLRRLGGLPKDSTGYDLPGLLCGSEGTLAVVTRARLRLVAPAGPGAVALCALDSVAGALALLGAVRGVPGLQAVELMLGAGVELVRRHAGLPAPLPRAASAPAWVLVEAAADPDPAEALAAAVELPAVLDVAAAAREDARGRAALWAYRERHSEAVAAEGVPRKLDVAVPLSALPGFVARVHELAEDAGARAIVFGHLVEGNLHVNLLEADDRLETAVLRLVAALDGSISAEHGVGVAKARWLHLTRDAVDRAAMAAIKRALDPTGVLNPGVLVAGWQGHHASRRDAEQS